MHILLIIIAAAIGIGRFFIEPRLNLPTAEGSYEACAHLFVGAMLGAAAVAPRYRYFYLAIGLGLSLLELFAFLYQRAGG